MSTKVSNAETFKFALAVGMNGRIDQIMELIDRYLVRNRLRQGIYQSDLTEDNYKVLVSELRTHWDGAVGVFKRKALGEDVEEGDTSQTLVVAKQVRNVVDRYFANNPSAPKDDRTRHFHIYLNSVFVVESLFQVQNDRGSCFAQYVLSDSVVRVDVADLFFVRHGENVIDLEVRELRDTLDREFADNTKQALEIRNLKGQLEGFHDLKSHLGRFNEMRLEIKSARSAEKAAHRNAEKEISLFVNYIKRLQDERAEARDRAAAAEQKIEELMQQLKDQKA